MRIRVYRATLDTNVFVRSFLSPSGINARVVDLWMDRRFILVLSVEIINEIEEILIRPSLMNRGGYTEDDVQLFVDQIYEEPAQGVVIGQHFRQVRRNFRNQTDIFGKLHGGQDIAKDRGDING